MSVPALLLDAPALARRRALAAGPLRSLARSLADDLHAAAARDPLDLPAGKARLTRAGGNCPRCGLALDFDPFAGDAHVCAACDVVFRGEAHDGAWRWRRQLWLAERAVHGAVLHALAGHVAAGHLAARILDDAATRYLGWPNRDNVLGPTRPFFSTYLESLWLLSLAVALDLLEAAPPAGADVGALGARVRDRLVEPSRDLIAGYPEGRSNRQVWNAAARLAAARLLGDAPGADDALVGRDGLVSALRDGLLADGSWWEGDNYHQFAHRGLWYGVTMAERGGHVIAPELLRRFAAGFAVPFRVALPDRTLPARRDSQYAIPLRQWRWAEWAELGLAHAAHAGDDALAAELAGALALVYERPDGAGAGAGAVTGRWRASGEAERNEAAVGRLARADLGWKALLFALPSLPAAAASNTPPPMLLPAQGLTLLRADAGRIVAALDYGAPGGGHGHPDRLNVLLQDGAARWLDDPGTGSYVERTLHWYRSTLAHAAPLVDERSQSPATGRLLGWDAAPGAAVQGVRAAANIASAVCAERALLLVHDARATYLLDRLVWSGDGWRSLDLALGDLPAEDLPASEASATAVDRNAAVGTASPGSPMVGPQAIDLPTVGWQPTWRAGAGGLEDGFDFLGSAWERPLASAGERVTVAAGLARGTVHVHASTPATLWRAEVPGPPGQGPRPRGYVRALGPASGGVLLIVRTVRGEPPARVEVEPDGRVLLHWGDGRWDEHCPCTDEGDRWTVRRGARDRTPEVLHLALGAAGLRDRSPVLVAPDAPPVVAPPTFILPAHGAARSWTLGAAAWRRSEESWEEAGRPTARVTLAARAGTLHIHVDVRLAHAPCFVAAGAENPLDNERAEVNGDGLQLHLQPPDGEPLAWLLVPDPAAPPAVRVVPTLPAARGVALHATARRTTDGWAMELVVPAGTLPPGVPIALDVLVNERPPERERRRGQLVWSAAVTGEAPGFVYLQGDRRELARAPRVVLPPEL